MLVAPEVLAGVALGRFDVGSICYYVYIYVHDVVLCSVVRVRTKLSRGAVCPLCEALTDLTGDVEITCVWKLNGLCAALSDTLPSLSASKSKLDGRSSLRAPGIGLGELGCRCASRPSGLEGDSSTRNPGKLLLDLLFQCLYGDSILRLGCARWCCRVQFTASLEVNIDGRGDWRARRVLYRREIQARVVVRLAANFVGPEFIGVVRRL